VDLARYLILSTWLHSFAASETIRITALRLAPLAFIARENAHTPSISRFGDLFKSQRLANVSLPLETKKALVPATTFVSSAPTAEQKQNEKNDQYGFHLDPH
jgi:hypothetical protein